jgi:hypothetical protein
MAGKRSSGGSCEKSCSRAAAGQAGRACRCWNGSWSKGGTGGWDTLGQVQSIGRNDVGIVVDRAFLETTPLLDNVGEDLAAVDFHDLLGTGTGPMFWG